jgi:hypothetical protein
MNREEVYAFLTADRKALVKVGFDPQTLAERYPFCSVFRAMAAEYAHVNGNPAYDQRLRVAAVYAYKREMLYDLLLKPALEQTVRAFDEEVEQFAGETAEASVHEPTEIKVDEPAEVALEQAPVLEEYLHPVIHPKEEDHQTVETVAFVEEVSDTVELTEEATIAEVEPLKRATEYDALQREILIEAIASSIEMEVMEEEPDDAPELPAHTADAKAVKSTDHSPGLEGKSAYARWLLNRGKGDSEQPAESLPADPKAKQSALIDRFIATDPKITQGKADLFSTENLAKMSLVEDEEFVTETMAMIYARQGHTKKAIRAYTLLGLKYPEKSVYFANQIKRLQLRPK